MTVLYKLLVRHLGLSVYVFICYMDCTALKLSYLLNLVWLHIIVSGLIADPRVLRVPSTCMPGGGATLDQALIRWNLWGAEYAETLAECIAARCETIIQQVFPRELMGKSPGFTSPSFVLPWAGLPVALAWWKQTMCMSVAVSPKDLLGKSRDVFRSMCTCLVFSPELGWCCLGTGLSCKPVGHASWHRLTSACN